MTDIEEKLKLIFNKKPYKIVLSKTASKTEQYKKIVITRKKSGYQIEKFTQKQAFHENVSEKQAEEFCTQELQGRFMQLNAWDDEYEHIVLISRKGKISYKKKAVLVEHRVTEAHNKEKNYILQEGKVIPPLVDMGIFTKEGKVVRSMYDKFRQINRFIEIIDDAVRDMDFKSLNIIDFGCGKSYLTFILYYYFTEIKKIKVNITGLDLKSDVIDECQKAAEKYGYDNLHFEIGDINGYKCNYPVDMVITLHACDTATDYALFNAINWGAKMIFSVPCCQHEVNSQIHSDKLSILTKYGIIKERTSALITDAIRGNLLEASGYKTQILEFIDMEHTPKNILIRAIKRPMPNIVKEKAMLEAENIINEFNINPTLYRLLKK
jgi:SAM-dependent methyltransferase